jgi:septum site-determining protein MinC
MGAEPAIKGIREGLLISLGDGSWENVLGELLQRLDSNTEFFRGARVALRLGPRSLRVSELADLRNEFSQRGLTLWAALSDEPGTQSAARSLGLEIELPENQPEDKEVTAGSGPLGSPAILVQHTLRSGNLIQYSGHVVVVGDVNPGAEIVAGGNIIVWGRLRGVAHAGAEGNRQAVVCALDLSPTQLRIAEHAATSPPRRGPPYPEVALLRGEELVAERWESGERRADKGSPDKRAPANK